MERLQEYINKKGKSEKNIAIAKRILSNKQYAEKIGDYGNKLYIWNIEDGGYIHWSHLQNPRIKNKPRYTQDIVYQKLAGVRHRKNGNKRAIAGGMNFALLSDAVIRGLMTKIEDRQMNESDYASLLMTPRADLYNDILKKTSEAYHNALDEIGYDESNYKPFSFSDERLEKLKEARTNAARKLEEIFNIDLSGDFPKSVKKYLPEELAEMHPVMARYHILRGDLAELIDVRDFPSRQNQKKLTE